MKPITVIGGANVDLCGSAIGPVVPKDSNPGRVRMTAGGVGRNIAESLARLGLPVRLICALGRDEQGAFLDRQCRQAGIDMSMALYPAGGRTSCYLCLNDQAGDLLLAVSDMEICRSLIPQALETALPLLNDSALCVVDANLPLETIEYLALRVTVPLAADPVSVAKAPRLRPALSRLAVLKPNLPEARALTGLQAADAPAAAQALHRMGVERVFLSLGAQGAYYLDREGGTALPCLPGPVVDTTGCGDAFLAAALAGVVQGFTGRQPVLRALAAAALRAAGRPVTQAAISQAIKDGGVV